MANRRHHPSTRNSPTRLIGAGFMLLAIYLIAWTSYTLRPSGRPVPSTSSISQVCYDIII
jgi:hypothetical protein